MLFRTERAIFVHIQKTGGNAIASALGRNPDCPEKHFLARDLQRLYGDDVWNSCFKFAFVRNPWDRLVSWWTMIDAQRPAFASGAHFNNFQSFVLQRATTFEEFLENCDEEIVDTDGRKWIYRNQIDYLTDSVGHCIVDFIGRFERLEADFEHVAQNVLGKKASLAHVNRSVHAHYATYYTPALAAKVERRFKKDIAAFCYTFQ